MRRADIDCAAVVPGLGEQVAAAVRGDARGVERARAADRAGIPVEGTTHVQTAGAVDRAAGKSQNRIGIERGVLSQGEGAAAD